MRGATSSFVRLWLLFATVVSAVLSGNGTAFATAFVSSTGGSWCSPATWSSSNYPGELGPGDTASILVGPVTVDCVVPNAISGFQNTGGLNVTTGSLALSGPASPSTGPLTISGGTLDLGPSGVIVSAGTLTWSGGTITGAAGGALLVQASANTVALDSSVNPLTLAGPISLTLVPLVNYTPGAQALLLNGGAQLTTSNTFLVGGDGTIGGSGGTFLNTGVFQKTAGLGGLQLSGAIVFTNNGNVNINTGSLSVGVGGTSSGQMTAAAGTMIDFKAATYTIAPGGAFSFGAGDVRVSGTATLAFTGLPIVTIPSLLFAAGVINLGPGTLVRITSLTWTGGSMQGSGNAQLMGTGSVNPVGVAISISGSSFQNSGTFTYTPGSGTFSLSNGSVFTNSNTFNFAGDGLLGGGGSASVFGNFGLFSKTAGTPTGLSGIGSQITFDNQPAGTVQSLIGKVGFSGPTFSSGTYDAPSGGIDLLTGGSLTITGAATCTPGTVMGILGGNFNVNTNFSVPNLFQIGGNTNVGVGSTLTISSALNFTSGTFKGPGTTTVTGATTLSPSPVATIDSAAVFNNNGLLTFTPGPFAILNGSTFNNNGTFNATNDALVDGVGAMSTFNNAGLLVKSGGAGALAFQGPLSLVNTSTGTVRSQSGAIVMRLSGNHSSAGVFDATVATASIDLDPGATLTLNPGASFTPAAPGALRMLGGTLTVNTNFSVNRLIQNSGNIFGNAPNTLTITTLTWDGGGMFGTGATTVTGTTTMSAVSSTTLDTRTFNNPGTGTFLYSGAAATFAMQNGATFNNAGIFEMVGNGNLDSFGTPCTFNNLGTGVFRKNGGSGGTANGIGPTFVNAGSVVNLTGNTGLNFNGPVTSTASWTTGLGGSWIYFAGGVTHTLQPGTTLNGGGFFGVAGLGTTLVLNTSVSPAQFELIDGTVTGTGNLTVTSLNWLRGTMSGAAVTSVSGTTSMSLLANAILDGRTFNNGGTLTLTPGSFSFFMNNGAIFNNGSTGTFNVAGDGALVPSAGTATFNNDGVLARTGGSGNFTLAPGTFNNQSTGTLRAGPGILVLGSTVNDSGVFDLSGVLWIASGTTFVNAGATFTGAAALNLFGGTLTINAAVTIPTLAFSSGTLNGPGALTINSMGWGTGTMSGTGSTTITGGANIQPMGAVTLDQRALNIASTGVVIYYANFNSFTLSNGATINNAGTIGADTALTTTMSASGTGNAINNTGSFDANGGPGTLTIPAGIAFTNTGAAAMLRLRDGGLTIQGPFTNSAGQIEIWNNSTLTMGSPLALGGGSLKGDGTVVSSTVTNDGTVDPGLSPGILNITGDYVQTSTGILNIELNGTAAGTGYDQLNVSGGVTLAGTLDVTPIGGFVPPAGNSYTIFSFASRVPAATDFTTKNLNGAAATLTPGYTPTALVLAAGVALQTDLSITKTAPAIAFHNQNISYTIVVTNNGPDPATGVTMTDTLPAQMTFVSASPTVGSCSGTTTVTCTIGSLANAASATITIVASATTPGNVTNTASVTGAEADSNAANNNAAAATLVTPSTDLGIAKSGLASVPANGTLTYTLTVTNAGPDPAATLQVFDTLPGGVTFTSATGPLWNCALAGSTVTCNFVSVPPPPASPVPPITIVVTAPATAGSITNTAGVGPTTDDPILSNNTATATTLVTASADLSITKNGPPTVAAGGNVTYTIAVTNNGPSAVTNVQVNDSPGPGLTFVSSAAPCSGGFPCTIATLNPSQTVSFTSTWSVSSSATGTITNNATVFGPGVTDPVPGNDTSTSTASVAIDSDVSITKAGPASVAPGGTVAYTITVTNLGPSDATGVVVSDPTPAGTTFVSTSCGPSFPCTIGSLPVGGTVTITTTYSVNATATGSITNAASVASASTDGNSANNSATTAATVVPKADVAITKSGPSALSPGGTIVFTITIRNFGPSDATAITVNDSPSSGLTFASNAGACTGAFPCAIGSLVAGASTTITSTFNVSGSVTSVTNTATVTSSTLDPNAANNSSSVTVGGPACLAGAPAIFVPFDGQTDVGVSGTLLWSSVGASAYDVYLGPAGSGCTTLVASVSGTSFAYSGLNANAVYEAKVVGRKATCPPMSSACIRFTTGEGACNLAAPQLQQPQNGSSAGSPVLLQWSNVGADSYRVVVTVNGVDAVDQTTPNTTLTVTIPNGTATWKVTATQGNCTAASATGTFNVCAPPAAPIAGVVGATTTNRAYSVLVVDASTDTTKYEFQEADNVAFLNAQTTPTTSASVEYQHDAQGVALVFFYRVRAFTACTSTPGDYSRTIRVVILPNLVNLGRPAVNVPAGSRTLVVQQVFIPGDTDRVAFTATADRPWIVNIDPASGILPPEGITLNVTLDPAQLPNGTFTATVIVTTSPLTALGGRPIETHAGNKKSAPVTINLVTPVIPVDPDRPASDSVFIPAVGHLAGLNSQWRSDVRIYNPAPVALKYLLNFTPNGSTEVKRTTIETAANATTALDDIIHNWYGVGEVGDSVTGVLEVRPLAPEVAPAFSLQPVVASRTFNAGAEGTVGQFIPGVPFTKFIGNGLRQSMQQIAQSAAYRTNFAVVEGSGSPASVVLSMFNSAGNKLFDLPVNLGAGEQKLLNGLLTAQGVSVADGRMEVRVSGGDGKVTAYASVVDNASLDPQFIPGATLDAAGSRLYVVPGVADLNNGLATWRTDIRIFNSGSTSQSASMTFYPEGNGAPLATSVTVLPNEVKVLDNVLQSVFATRDAGGAVQVTTAADSQFVVTGRTFNQTSTGSLGQFIRAATAADGVGRNTRSLNILQVEDSVRFRTNIGLAEMSGKAARVEVSVTLPDSKVTPIIEVPLGANEFRQFSVSQFGLGDIYNARVSLRVIDGDGTVTAYGSLIDQVTTDPTYVAAQ